MYAKLVKINDGMTEATLKLQVNEPGSRYYGGVNDGTSGVPRPTHVQTCAVMAVWEASLLCPDSRYYQDRTLLEALDKAADFIVSKQHADGTVSLGSTNYNSPPDTAFVVGGMVPMVQLMEKQEWEEIRPVEAKLKRFLERTIPAMVTGGCHTPNHRWVLTAALVQLNELFPGRPELLKRAGEWLAEGLDLTEDGEWTERSNGIYNAVSDINLFHAGRLLNRPELIECVRRNLRMMVYLVHPSGEVVTEYSGRQDFGQKSTMQNYYLPYRLMAAYDRDPLFAAMADYAGSFMTYTGGINDNALIMHLLHPEWMDVEGLERAELPERYVKIINGNHPVREHLALMKQVGHHNQIQHSRMHTAFGSPLVRIRDGGTSATIMTRTPSFFSLRHGPVRLLGVKAATAFTPGIVAFEDFMEENGVYKLETTMEKGYSGPVPKEFLSGGVDKEGISPWYLLPHQHRPMTHLQKHRIQAEVEQAEGGRRWEIRIRSDEREDVYTQVTFILGKEGQLNGRGLVPFEEGRYFLKEGSFQYSVGSAGLEIEGGAYDHWLPGIREDDFPGGCLYVHVNLLTPFDRTFTIRLQG